jgi:hypothetical protein
MGTLFVFLANADAREIAHKITFAKVRNVDEANRRITLESPEMQAMMDRMNDTSQGGNMPGGPPPEFMNRVRGRGMPMGPVGLRGAPGPSSSEIPARPPGARRPFVLSSAAENRKNLEKITQEFIKTHGKENVLTLSVRQPLDEKQQERVVRAMTAIAGPIKAHFVDGGLGQSGRTTFGFAVSGDVQKIADAIKFAKVRTVDVEDRWISVDSFEGGPPARPPVLRSESKTLIQKSLPLPTQSKPKDGGE